MPAGKYKTFQQTETITGQLGPPSPPPSPPNHSPYIAEEFSERLITLFFLNKGYRGSSKSWKVSCVGSICKMPDTEAQCHTSARERRTSTGAFL